MLHLVNVSNWQSFSIGEKTYYSPNTELIAKLKQNPEFEFWKTTYTEFACIVVDNTSGIILLVRDHFGCEPFFYYLTPRRIYFASSLAELIPALRQDGIVISVNEIELKYMLWVGKMLIHSTKVHEDTLYNGIKRVKPNHVVTISANKVIQTQYWSLSSNCNETIYYKNEDEYLEHFSELLHEGVKLQIGAETAIAAECSGGLDSSSIILAAHHLNKPLMLYTHLDQDYDPAANRLRESYFVEQLVHKYAFKHSNINADDFNLPEAFEMVTNVLAGQMQSIFPLGANIIHAQVAAGKSKILLSGFGGDECVSGHANLSAFLPQLLKRGEYKKAWQEYHQHYIVNKLPKPAIIAQAKTWIRAQFPDLGEKIFLRRYQQKKQHFAKLGFSLPEYLARASSVAEFEVRQLIGIDNNHISYRIEDSALIARHYGFKYKYPLLYPKLVEFCNRLPLHMKRENGLARIMIRKYLAQAGMPEFSSKPIAKFDGSIMGSALTKIKETYQSHFEKQLNSPLLYNEIQLQILNSDPNLLSNSKLYQDLALLVLNQYLVK
ncbi:MAG TPA: hypothetical protein DHV02_02215 [Neisseriales bacterium]|nr:hypothetical protein [Neisseriales bacterium]